MTDEIVRKFVKPAHEGASIPDPVHQRDLPQEGMNVVWDHYWIGRELSGDVTVSEFRQDPKPGEKTAAGSAKEDADIKAPTAPARAVAPLKTAPAA